MEAIRKFGAVIGDEVVIRAGLGATGEPAGFLVLAELRDAAAFRSLLETQIADLSKVHVHMVDDPATATSASGDNLYVWIDGTILAVAPDVASIRELAASTKSAGANPFVGTPFHSRIAAIYRDGAGLVVAADPATRERALVAGTGRWPS
jgi:hypothetical protein